MASGTAARRRGTRSVGPLAYAVADVEWSEPLPTIALAPHESGVGLLVRRGGRPALFVLEALRPGERLGPGEIRALVAAHGGVPDGQSPPPLPSSTPGPAITVVVCTRSRVGLLRECLQSILRAIDREGTAISPIEVLVVDNAPDDTSTRDLVAGVDGVRYALEPLPGLDFARNRAVAEATGTFLAFVDDDAVVDHGWLPALRDTLARNPDAAAVTGLIVARELATEAQIVFERRGGLRKGFSTVRYEGDRHDGNVLFPCGVGLFGAGCNMVVRRDAVLRLGGFDDALDTGPPLPSGGDLDMFYRVLRFAGPLIYEPSMLVFHKHRADLPGLRRQYWNWGRGFAAFAHKTIRRDPPMRRRMLRTMVWWLGYMRHEIRRSARRGSGVRVDLPLAELVGGLVGMTLTYPRSVARSARIRRGASAAVPRGARSVD